MTTDISERSLETLIVAVMTGPGADTAGGGDAGDDNQPPVLAPARSECL